jgi:hypothetical protein
MMKTRCGRNIGAVAPWKVLRRGVCGGHGRRNIVGICAAANEGRRKRTNRRKNNPADYCEVGAIPSLWAQFRGRSSVGRRSYGASAAAMVAAISLVLVYLRR